MVDAPVGKHVRVEDSKPAKSQTNDKVGEPDGNNGKQRVVTMEHSVATFEGKSSTRRDRTTDPVMITDALSDVREK